MHLGHHDCGHDHAHHTQLNRSFAIAVVLNVLLVIGEAVGGVLSHSVALLADAGHNLSDVAGLILAWWAHWLRSVGPSGRWTYGRRPFTILAANLNGILIVAAIVGVGYESIRRLISPVELEEVPVLIVGLIAAGLNFATARLLTTGGQQEKDLNVRGAYLHMLADAAVSVAVVIGAAVIFFTDWYWLDPLISLGICALLAFGVWDLLRESTSLLMHAAPKATDVEEVSEFLLATPEVEAVGDLHIWSVSTTDVLLTAHLVCPGLDAESRDALVRELHEGLEGHFGIAHATLEVTQTSEGECSLRD